MQFILLTFRVHLSSLDYAKLQSLTLEKSVGWSLTFYYYYSTFETTLLPLSPKMTKSFPSFKAKHNPLSCLDNISILCLYFPNYIHFGFIFSHIRIIDLTYEIQSIQDGIIYNVELVFIYLFIYKKSLESIFWVLDVSRNI